MAPRPLPQPPEQPPLRLPRLRHVAVFRALKSQGWTVLKRGWPTFICLHPERRPIAVYVKPSPRAGLGKYAPLIIAALEWLGLKVYIGYPDRNEPTQGRLVSLEMVRGWKDENLAKQ